MKVVVCWDVAPYSLEGTCDVSEERTAPIFTLE